MLSYSRAFISLGHRKPANRIRTNASFKFQVAKPCSRCRVTTVDSARGEFSGKEPLKTLATYRNVNGKTLFGQNLIHRQAGRLQVGNQVSIVDALNH